MKKIIRISLSLFLVCFIAVGALAGVEYLTRGQIEKNSAEEIQKALNKLIPQAQYEELTDDSIVRYNDAGEFEKTQIRQVFAARDDDGSLLGHIVVVTTQGYVDEIGLRVGVLTDGTVTGVVIGENSETPGLGGNIAKESFLGQFQGGKAPFDKQDVDGITSATYSTAYVLRGINAACGFITFMEGEKP